ncbi:MAG: D-alanine--D-alanine ligase family protein [bacterium]|nr:D-alanine--D-alanine ligase family protein [bacterium]
MTQPIQVGIIFGGKSPEHEVSLASARNVVEAMDRKTYTPVLIGISKEGKWLLCNTVPETLNGKAHQHIVILPESNGKILNIETGVTETSLDVAFPVLHGQLGEDGTMQGLLKIANIPFVGAGVLGSAVGMDKDVMKRLLREAGIPVARFLTVTRETVPTHRKVADTLGTPFFLKPSRLGSSVGIHKVCGEEDFKKGLQEAFLYDTKVILEEFVQGREIECSVLGNKNPRASVLGEIISQHEFYSYQAKYVDKQGAVLEIPAKLPQGLARDIQNMAIRVFQTLSCEGLGRVDMFLKENGEILVNEINTIPGFTSISMYPKLWEASGISYASLIDQLIQLALERFAQEKTLKTSY